MLPTRPLLDGRSYALSLMKHPGDPVLDAGTVDCVCMASGLADQGTQLIASGKARETLLVAREYLNDHSVKKAVWLLQDDITASGIASGAWS